jgi:hypothetical protein
MIRLTPACWAARVAGSTRRIGRTRPSKSQLTKQDCSAQFIGPEDPLSRKNRCDDREVKMREKPYLKVVAASGAAEQFRRYGTSGLMPGVRRVRTSSSATRISLMLLSWETRRITLKAWSASIL